MYVHNVFKAVIQFHLNTFKRVTYLMENDCLMPTDQGMRNQIQHIK